MRIDRDFGILFAGLALVVGSLQGSSAATCSVAGGTAIAPTNLGSAIANQTQCDDFLLGNGEYSAATISRARITVRALNRCQAKVRPELSVRGQNVTIDGVSITGSGTALTVYTPGVRILNSCIQGFGKTQWANGIWVLQEALDPANRIIISGNELDDWGGAMYSGGIAIGKADDNYAVPSSISVEVTSNRVTRGPTAGGIYNAAVQSFHPILIDKNFIDTVSGTSFQLKTFNSRISCNEATHILGDGALYNRLNSNNLWEYNLVHDSDVGIDHFMGNGNIFRGNVIFNVIHPGRVKNMDIGSTHLTFENNTFYHTTGWAGFIWDNTSSGPLSNILWRNNIFHTVNGSAINTSSALDPLWDETQNIFYLTTRPTGTTGASGTSSTTNPRFVSPPSDFTVQESAVQGKGAPWPLPCGQSSSGRCDLNGDTSTNVGDVQLCANQAIGADPCLGGDVNQDGQCNVIDVQRVVNAALGGACVMQ